MTSLAPGRARASILTVTVRRGSALYGLILLLISLGYYAYWVLWQMKAYYISWLMGLGVIVLMALYGQIRLTGLPRAILPVCIWYGYLFASSLWSPSSADTLYFASAGLINIVAFVLAYGWQRSASPRELATYFELQIVLLLPIIAFFLLTIGQLYDDSLGAVRTGFASTCLTALPFVLWKVRQRPSIGSAVILLCAFLLIISGESRSALLIAPLLVLGFVLFVGERRQARPSSLVVTALLLLVVMLVAMTVPAVREALHTSLGRFTSKSTSLSISSEVLTEVTGRPTERVDIERRLQLFIALRSFVQHPIIGAGFESTLTIIQREFGWNVSAHGLPSTLLGETGLLGTAIFIWMITRFYRSVRQAKEVISVEQREFMGVCKLAIFGLLCLGMFHQVDQNPALYIVLAWGYGVRDAAGA